MTITRNFKLCLNAGTQNAPYINANQYDEGEEWVFDLYTEGGQKFTPSTGAIIGIKSDGNAILNSGTVNASGQVVITETQQMTAASGLAVFELLIEGETHGTANFIVNVERRPSDDAEFSDSDLSMLQEAIDAAEVINEILDEGGDPSEIIAENVNAWLDNHPEATTTVQDGAITAPKINNSLWDKILVNEEASGNPASFEDGADDVPVSSLKVNLEPIQTGSGDPSPSNIRPIIASNGKNILPLTVASCQTNSTAGTWSGNAYTHLGVTYTLNTGADGTVESVTMNGTSTGASELRIALVSFDPTKTYKVNGITGATSSTYRFNIGGVGTYYDNDYTVTFEDASEHICRLQVPNGVAVSNVTVQPMIRLDGTDATFQPYQGIIVERTGKNLLFDETVYTAGSQYRIGASSASVYPFALKAGTYTMSNAGTAAYLYWQKEGTTENNIIHNDSTTVGTFTLTEDGNYRFWFYNTGDGLSFTDIQLELGNTATEYEPYVSPVSYPISLGREVYGGSVDLATGVLTVTHFLYEYDGTESFIKSDTALNGFYNRLTGAAPHSWPIMLNYDGVSLTNERSNMYVPTRNVTTYKNNYGYVYFDNGHNFNCDPDVFGTTVDSFKAKLAELYANGTPVSVFCRIATPQTYQLTPQEVKTLLGYNNISSSGNVDVIYHADTKLYIDKKIGELS